MNLTKSHDTVARGLKYGSDVASDPRTRDNKGLAPPEEFFSELRAEARRATDEFFLLVGNPQSRIRQNSRH